MKLLVVIPESGDSASHRHLLGCVKATTDFSTVEAAHPGKAASCALKPLTTAVTVTVSTMADHIKSHQMTTRTDLHSRHCN